MKNFMRITGYSGLAIMISIFFIACNGGKKDDSNAQAEVSTAKPDESTGAVAVLTGTVADTTLSGKIDFMAENGKVKMMLTLSIPSMANKSVAVHIHEMGDCGDMGKDAHGHWNPTNQQHGKWGVGSFHSGDIGNVSLDASGNGSMELETDLWSIGGDEKTNILNRSIIVHSGMDDFTSQPSGNAGSRIGCGVITKK